jgi:Uma2 family endonuclease
MAFPAPMLQPDFLPQGLHGALSLREIADLLNEHDHRVEYIRHGELVIDEEIRTLREIADELLENYRVEYIREDELIFVPPAGFTHYTIIQTLVKFFNRAFPTLTDVDWQLGSENFQWDLLDAKGSFFIPDLVVASPGAGSRREVREDIKLLVEVTSPKDKPGVHNDRVIKPRRYARGGMPLFLLIDQGLGTWTLHQLIDNWPKYQIHSTGYYGESGAPIALPDPFGFSIPTDQWPPYVEGGE